MKKFKNLWGKNILKGRLETKKGDQGGVDFFEKYNDLWVSGFLKKINWKEKYEMLCLLKSDLIKDKPQKGDFGLILRAI